MKKFNFRLQRILDFKEQVEQQKRQLLADRSESLKKEKNQLFSLMTTREKYSKLYSSLFHGKLDIHSLKSTLSYVDAVRRKIKGQTRRVVDAETKVENARIEVRDSMRDRKKYEKLKERRHGEYLENSNRVEQKELDELASRRLSGVSG